MLLSLHFFNLPCTHRFCHDIIKCLKEIFKFIKTLFTPFSLTFSRPPLPILGFSEQENFAVKAFRKKEGGGRGGKENEK
jgi:hypothetical protein